MAKVNLQNRLFLSHVLVMLVGIIGLVMIDDILHPRFFIRQLESVEQRGIFKVRVTQIQIVRELRSSKHQSTVWSILIGAGCAGGLSYWVARRITRPLMQMEKVTQGFASGQLTDRMPTSDIPELASLSHSFNQMANSIEGSEQRRRELIGDLTHELRTPLTVVRGYLEELADERIQPSAEIYLRLVQETRRLERLVNDLQELSKAEAGYLTLQVGELELYPLLKKIVQRFADQILEEGPVLTLNCPPELPRVLADADRTEQILVNLVGNAIQYTEKGFITIQAWTVSDRVWVAVTDTGVGIAPEELPHVFERFWRSGQSRARYGGGTGIGLAIARRLVELQQGHIEVDSQVGKGSTFRFSLPLAT